jgi:hypothetical protein
MDAERAKGLKSKFSKSWEECECVSLGFLSLFSGMTHSIDSYIEGTVDVSRLWTVIILESHAGDGKC